jgi:hypothetical protein
MSENKCAPFRKVILNDDEQMILKWLLDETKNGMTNGLLLPNIKKLRAINNRLCRDATDYQLRRLP